MLSSSLPLGLLGCLLRLRGVDLLHRRGLHVQLHHLFESNHRVSVVDVRMSVVIVKQVAPST